ncbi:MAG: filamentous hemagglutinin N-terminal domain-containing protein [Xenococcaceae cyanobacterium MO_188.B32]|nr:filamentous hemagglutinin N-terminal domain-containing protein [Xenococcaceae cyanobacterium MO_188.B32]
MNKNLGSLTWQSFLLGSLTLSGILIFNLDRAMAQIIPDNTLGDENSIVNPRDATSDSIDGGARRGQNLFHSFQEFNVDAGRGIYFSNPDAVNNIFSRVTGNNVSNILGTLGVDGAANLFLINPNGIIFGEDARLDIQGSFAATTADGIEFDDRGFFSATQPEQSSLLTINPGAFFYNQVANQPGNIINRGNLVTGQDLIASMLRTYF